MKRKYFLLLMFAGLNIIVEAQDKNAEAIVHYTKAEDYYNQNTFLGAEKCIEELREAEEILGSTNSKILYLKIMAASKFGKREYYYAYDNINWLQQFYRITDTKTFPTDKYTSVINSGYLPHLVKDAEFERKIKTDSAFIKQYFNYSPFYKFTAEAYYKHGEVFRSESFQASHGNSDNMQNDPGYEKAHTYYYLAADKGSHEAMSRLSSQYLRGEGVIVDEKKSFEYATIANDTMMITLLYNVVGEKVINNGLQAIKWCEGVFSSADKFSAESAAVAIAKVYEKAIGGVPKDNYKAMEWYIKANTKGCDCKNYMDLIVLIGINKDDKKTQKAVRELYSNWIKSKR